MLIIGHRGAKGLAPENTLESFQVALDNHVDMIELDIRTSSDGEMVVHHDASVQGLEIVSTQYADLKKAKLDLVTLHDAIEFIDGRCPIVIEIKKGAYIAKFVEAFKANPLPRGTMIASFNLPILKVIKNNFPELTLVVNESWSGVRGSMRCKKLGTIYLTMNQRWLWFGFIKSMSRSGYKLSAYPLNDAAKAKKWSGCGLFAAITDRPDLYMNE